MAFIESYKHLEKMCGEILNDERRLSAYIDEMLKIPNGAFYVTGWNEDLKKLKHYRWIRNQISHEPGCTEQNMCEPSDTDWLDNFYKRIMNQTDPLALYYQATKSRKMQQSHKPQTYNEPLNETYSMPHTNNKNKSNNSVYYPIFIICALLFVAVIICFKLI